MDSHERGLSCKYRYYLVYYMITGITFLWIHSVDSVTGEALLFFLGTFYVILFVFRRYGYQVFDCGFGPVTLCSL
jgi:hypothetical protein